MSWSFFLESAILGAGLAMDAFSASIANALKEPKMGFVRGSAIAGVFALFQIAMPLIGWLCVHTLASRVTALFAVTPWIALALLAGSSPPWARWPCWARAWPPPSTR